MSELRRKRREEREDPAGSRVNWRKIGIAMGIVIVLAGVYYFIYYKHGHRYDAFAHCLREKQLTMYGAYWCPHCAEQKELFGGSFSQVPYVECGIPGQRGETQHDVGPGVSRGVLVEERGQDAGRRPGGASHHVCIDSPEQPGKTVRPSLGRSRSGREFAYFGGGGGSASLGSLLRPAV